MIDPLTGVFLWTPTEFQGPSTNIITIRVTDDGSPPLSSTNSLTVIVAEVNRPPELTVSSQWVDELTTLTITNLASDSDFPANTLTFELISAPVGVQLDPLSGLLTWTPTEFQGPSTNVITIRVTDDGLPPLSSTNSLTVVVREVNTPPRLQPFEVEPLLEGFHLFLGVEVQDDDFPVNTLRFSLGTNAPAWAQVNPATGFLSIDLVEELGGTTFPLRVQVSDGGDPDLTDEIEILLTVLEVNRPPQLATPSQRNAQEGVELSFVAGTDPDLPPNHLQFELGPGAPAGATLDTATGAFRWTPGEEDGGTVKHVTISATDDGDPPLSALMEFTLTVQELNSAPALNVIGNVAIQEGQTVALQATATDPDIPVQNLQFSLAPGAPPGATINSNTGAFLWATAESAGPGQYNVTVVVTDSGSPARSSSQSFLIEVGELNEPPVIGAVSTQILEEGQSLSLEVVDPDLPANQLSYSLTGMPISVTLSWLSNPEPTVTGYRLRYGTAPNPNAFVVDLPGRSTTNTTVTNLSAGIQYQFSLTAFYDAERESPPAALAFAAGSIDEASGTVHWIPADLFGGTTQQFEVSVTDDGTPRLSTATSFSVTFLDSNLPPLLPLIPDQVFEEGRTGEIPCAAADPDIPEDRLAYSLATGSPSWAQINPTNGLLRLSPGDDLGDTDYQITVHVTDNGIPPLSDTRSFGLHFFDSNRRPAFRPLPAPSIYEGGSLSTMLEAEDMDIPVDTLLFTLEDGSAAGAVLNPATGELTWQHDSELGPGIYSIIARVTDNGSPPLSAQMVIPVSVLSISNHPPQLVNVTDVSVFPGEPLVFQITATDRDLPADQLTYSLAGSIPEGLVFSRNTGLVAWFPPGNHAPSTNILQVTVTDDGVPSLQDTAAFRIMVKAPGDPPPPDPWLTVDEGETISFSAVDPSLPLVNPVFTLLQSPFGAQLNLLTGLFTWTPNEDQAPGVYVVSVLVTDESAPPVNLTNSFTITIREVNERPALVPQPALGIAELTTLSLEVDAIDSDVPANRLIYFVLSAPQGVEIDPDTGLLTWTPNETQGPSTNILTLRVTDDGLPPLSATNTLTIVVHEANHPPSLAVPSDQIVDELTTLVVTNYASDTDLPLNHLTFSLVSAPAGAVIDPGNGTLTWTPSEAEGPNTNIISVRVTDDGLPALSTTNSFIVRVRESNRAPSLAALSVQDVEELSVLIITNVALDPDFPPNHLSFSLLSAPAGATLDPVSGIFTWIPSEADGPGTNLVSVRVMDDGVPSLNATNTFAIIVREANRLPALVTSTDQTIDELTTLVVTNLASDPDAPANNLSFSLLSAPNGAAIDPVAGVLTWTPGEGQGPSTNLITVRVTDDGSPPLSSINTFAVVVREINLSPSLVTPPNQNLNELTTLVVTNHASDPDLPTNSLSFALVSAPAGMQLDPASGILTWTPSEGEGPSTNTVVLRITDDGSPTLSSTNSFTIIVGEVNQPPLLGVPPNQVLDELTTLSVTNIATDTDLPANILTFSLLSSPPGVVIDPVTGVLTWTPDETQGPGNYLITLRVHDDATPSLESTNSFTIVVRESNQPPTLATIPDQTLDELTFLTITNIATDPDWPPNGLTYSIVSAPTGVQLDPATGILSWIPSEVQGPGSHVITLKVTDDGSPPLSRTNSFRVDVLEVLNQPPILTVASDQTLDELAALVVTNSASDPDLPANGLTFSLVSAPAGVNIHPLSGILTWTPSESQGPSTNLLIIRATDDGSPHLSTTGSFMVIVRELNQPPSPLTIPDQSIDELDTLTITNSASDPDLPANTLSYSLVSAPDDVVLDPASGVLTWTPPESAGSTTNVLLIRITDDGSPPLSATNSFAVAVRDVNLPPTFVHVPDQTLNELSTLVITNQVVDSDLPTNRVSLTVLSAPAGAVLDAGSGALTWTPSEAQGPGTYVIALRATDDGAPPLDATNSFTVTVREANQPPSIVATLDQTLDELTTLVLTNLASDPDLPANTLSFSLLSAPSGAVLNPVTGVLTWTPSEAQGPTTNIVTWRVTDNGMPAASATNSFTVTVREANQPPSIVATHDQDIDELTTLVLTNLASDPDLPANTLAFSLLSAPPGAVLNPATGVFTWAPSEAQGPTTNIVTWRVMDNGTPASSATNSFVIVVREVNQPPTLTMPPNQVFDELTLLVVTNLASDPDFPANDLSFTLLSGPAGAVLNPATGVLTWAPSEAQGPSTNTITIRVTDNALPPSGVTNAFLVVVREINQPPTLMVPAEVSVTAYKPLVFVPEVVDPDEPTNSRQFTVDNAPPTSQFDSNTGTLTWTPTGSDGGREYVVRIQVTDDGSPPLAAAEYVTLRVKPIPQPRLAVIQGEVRTIHLTINGQSGTPYRLEQSPDFIDWTVVLNTNAPADQFSIELPCGEAGRLFYRVASP